MVIDQTHTDRYSLYNADTLSVMPEIPDDSVDLSIYSPPFAKEGGGALYTYSSDPRDFSNAPTYADFMEQYRYLVTEIARVTKPGCFSAVHSMAIPATCNRGNYLTDFPGDIIRLHETLGFKWVSYHLIWKEPLAVRLRTMAKGLEHRTIVEDSGYADVAGGDFLHIFRKEGERHAPISHPTGLHEYYGGITVPADLQRFRGWTGDQKENAYSHWIWRRYASCIWDDIRGTLGSLEPKDDYSPVLPYEESRDADDEKHVHPLQLDVIARALELRTNPGDRILTPFMGVGSEVYQSVKMGRYAIGVDLKPSYYRQAVKNCASVMDTKSHHEDLFPVAELTSTSPATPPVGA